MAHLRLRGRPPGRRRVVSASAHRSRAVTAAPAIPTARVYRGVIEPTRRVAGSISAGRFANVAAPVLQSPDTGRGLTLTYLAESGTRVKKGQMIAQIDAQDIKDHLDDVEASIDAGRTGYQTAQGPTGGADGKPQAGPARRQGDSG